MLDKKFSWVETHMQLTEYLATKENSQKDLISLLKSVGISPFNDQNEKDNHDIELEEIDPFTFYCYIYKYGSKNRLQYLKSIAERLNLVIPNGDSGIPSAQAQKVWLFPYKYDRTNNELKRLWTFFKKANANIITDDDFEDVLLIKNVGKIKITEALFYLNPHEYLPINGPIKPFIKSEFGIEPKFNTYSEYRKILDKIKNKSSLPFYELSYKAWKWNEDRKVNYWKFQGNPKFYDLELALKNELLTDWTITSHKDKIKPGDNVVLWQVGKQSGCYALAEVISEPYVKKSSSDDHLWKDGHKKDQARLIVDIKITNNLIKTPILQSEIADITELVNFKTNSQGTNFKIKPKEYLTLLAIAEQNLSNQNQNGNQMRKSLNQILYGPPGTGKTYSTNILKDKFIIQNDSISDFDWAIKIVQKMSWWEVIALVLLDTGMSAKVPEIKKHELIDAKAHTLNKTQNINAQIWASLQVHTPLDSETVKYSSRTQPYIFKKSTKSKWSLCDDIEDTIPDILAEYKKYKNDKPREQTTKNYEFITFHQSYGYEEFVEGIKAIPPNEAGNDTNKMVYKVVDGVFKKLCKKAENNLDTNYAIIIDEINRGNISKIFGELITLIEESKRIDTKEELKVTLPYSGEEFGVPKNLHIIGTMNTADRSIALMDTALRRRFEFIEMMPDYSLLDNDNIDGIKLDLLLKKINQRIEYLYDRDHMIGHSYLMHLQNKADLDKAFRNKIIPLLQEYFYDDWEKIQIVLGDHENQKSNDKFITCKKLKDKEVLGFNYDEMDEDKMEYHINKNFSPEAYKKIYEKVNSNTNEDS